MIYTYIHYIYIYNIFSEDNRRYIHAYGDIERIKWGIDGESETDKHDLGDIT